MDEIISDIFFDTQRLIVIKKCSDSFGQKGINGTEYDAMAV